MTTRFERLRKKRRLKTIDIAAEANLSRQQVSRIRLGLTQPRRHAIAALVSALRRLTLEPIVAEDVFELTVEESGVWRKHRGSVLDRRGDARDAAAAFLRMHLRSTPPATWAALLARRPEMRTESLAAVLVLESRRTVSADPTGAAALAETAVSIAVDLAPITDPFITHLHGCALLAYGNALRHLGRYTEALAAFDRAQEPLSLHVASANELAQVGYARAIVLWKRDDFAAALAEERRAAVLFLLLGDERRYARTQLLEGGILFERGDAAGAKLVFFRAVDLLKETSDRGALASAWLNLGAAEAQLGNAAEAKVWIKKAAEAFRRLGIPAEQVRADWTLGYVLGMHGSGPRGAALLRQARRSFDDLKMPLEAGFVALDLAEVLLRDPSGAQEAAEVVRAALVAFQRAEVSASAAKALAYLQEAASVHAATTGLVATVRRYLKEVERHPEAVFTPEGTGPPP
jgi:tetratricopeptide (TPR) repeat protein/transcriptional regulator with XRE-family HTH domain